VLAEEREPPDLARGEELRKHLPWIMQPPGVTNFSMNGAWRREAAVLTLLAGGDRSC
jgi:hypothetical protein